MFAVIGTKGRRARRDNRIRRITVESCRFIARRGCNRGKTHTDTRIRTHLPLLKMPLGGVPVNMYNTCNYLVPFIKKKICAHKHCLYSIIIYYYIYYIDGAHALCTSTRRHAWSAASGPIDDDIIGAIGFRLLSQSPIYIPIKFFP